MAEVVLEGIDKVFPNGVQAICGLDLHVRDGEFLVLVGPSGCGKSTALRMIAGLEEITDGTMRIGDRVVNEVQPKDRDILAFLIGQRFLIRGIATTGIK